MNSVESQPTTTQSRRTESVMSVQHDRLDLGVASAQTTSSGDDTGTQPNEDGVFVDTENN